MPKRFQEDFAMRSRGLHKTCRIIAKPSGEQQTSKNHCRQKQPDVRKLKIFIIIMEVKHQFLFIRNSIYYQKTQKTY